MSKNLVINLFSKIIMNKEIRTLNLISFFSLRVDSVFDASKIFKSFLFPCSSQNFKNILNLSFIFKYLEIYILFFKHNSLIKLLIDS